MELIKSKVSVLMPVYNGLPLIKASIASLMKQSYTNWECIIVDDGSNDGTSEYLDTLNDSRFVVHHFEHNCGRPVARQKCLEMATGEYIAFLDAGDLYHPNKLSLQVDEITKNDEIALVGSRMCSFGTNTDKLYVRGIAKNTPTLYLGGSVPCHATCLLKDEQARKVSYNPTLQLGEDVDFLEKYLKGQKYKVLEDVLYFYSELDSVSKTKIKYSYAIYAQKFFREKKWKKTIIYTLKYFYSIFIFPFLSIDLILSKRGRPADDNTVEYFNNQIRILIDNSIIE